MPSSPEHLTVLPWQLTELHALGQPDPAADAAAEFVAADDAPALVPFELGGTASIPETVLAPARAAARAAGYLAGWSHGLHDARERGAEDERRRAAAALEAEQHRSAEFARAMSGLDRAAARLEAAAAPGAAEVEALIVAAALQIAEALVGHSLRHDPQRAEAALARVLDLTAHNEPVVVRLSPADHALLAERGHAADLDRSVTLVVDAGLAPGDAIATSGAAEIDARITTGLARVREVLGR